MSIRLRLTLIYSTILALTLIVFSALLYNIQARYTLGILEGDLSRAARSLAMSWARFRFVPGREGPSPNQDGQPPDNRSNPFVPGLRDLRVRDAVRLLGPDGSILDLNVNQQDIDLELPISAKMYPDSGRIFHCPTSDEAPFSAVWPRPVLDGSRCEPCPKGSGPWCRNG